MAESEQNSVDRVEIIVPPFWPTYPTLWFLHLERQFSSNCITQDETKYYYVLGNLEQCYLTEVKDIIMSPHLAGKYENIKSALIARISFTQKKKTQQLLEQEELGDRKPSQFLQHLRDLGGNIITESFIHTLWHSRLPAKLQAILETQKNRALEVDARIADKVMEVCPELNVTKVAKPTTESLTSAIEALTAKVKELEVIVEQHTSKGRNRSKARRSNRFRSRSRGRDSSRNRSLCWYHNRHGENANNCRSPCNFSSSGNTTRRR